MSYEYFRYEYRHVDILEKRYASGEVDQYEFERIKKELENWLFRFFISQIHYLLSGINQSAACNL